MTYCLSLSSLADNLSSQPLVQMCTEGQHRLMTLQQALMRQPGLPGNVANGIKQELISIGAQFNVAVQNLVQQRNEAANGHQIAMQQMSNAAMEHNTYVSEMDSVVQERNMLRTESNSLRTQLGALQEEAANRQRYSEELQSQLTAKDKELDVSGWIYRTSEKSY